MAVIEDDAADTDWATAPAMVPKKESDARIISKNTVTRGRIVESPIEKPAAAYLSESKSSSFHNLKCHQQYLWMTNSIMNSLSGFLVIVIT
jgi:hypothetical protein